MPLNPLDEELSNKLLASASEEGLGWPGDGLLGEVRSDRHSVVCGEGPSGGLLGAGVCGGSKSANIFVADLLDLLGKEVLCIFY